MSFFDSSVCLWETTNIQTSCLKCYQWVESPSEYSLGKSVNDLFLGLAQLFGVL